MDWIHIFVDSVFGHSILLWLHCMFCHICSYTVLAVLSRGRRAEKLPERWKRTEVNIIYSSTFVGELRNVNLNVSYTYNCCTTTLDYVGLFISQNFIMAKTFILICHYTLVNRYTVFPYFIIFSLFSFAINEEIIWGLYM